MGNASSFYNKLWVDYKCTNQLLQMDKGKEVASSSSSLAIPPRTCAPPQHNFFKLNTDGSWVSINNVGGGGVIRCDKGNQQIDFSLKFKTIGPDPAELLAIKKGLFIAWGRKNHQFGTGNGRPSSQKMPENPLDYHDDQTSSIIIDLATLLKRNWNVIILHVNSSVNGVDHGLADIGRTMDVECTYHFQPPKSIMQCYQKEIPPAV